LLDILQAFLYIADITLRTENPNRMTRLLVGAKRGTALRLAQSIRIAVLTAAAMAPVAFAQSAPHLSEHTFEVGGFVGSSYGLDSWRVMGGGNVTYGINRYILPYAEFSYFPGITREIEGVQPTINQPFTIRFDVPITDFHGGVHIRLPIKESRVVPYLVFGLGVLRSSERDYRATFRFPDGTSDELTGTVPSSSNFAVNTGGGLRFYLNQRLGFRIEAKVYKPTGDFNNPFGKVEGGFFIQFR
jgi:hypothetical protein